MPAYHDTAPHGHTLTSTDPRAIGVQGTVNNSSTTTGASVQKAAVAKSSKLTYKSRRSQRLQA